MARGLLYFFSLRVPQFPYSVAPFLKDRAVTQKRKIQTTCHYCGKNTAGTYARIAFAGGILRYCVSCYPQIVPALMFIDPEGMWDSVIEMLQDDEKKRPPGYWYVINCDVDKYLKLRD